MLTSAVCAEKMIQSVPGSRSRPLSPMPSAYGGYPMTGTIGYQMGSLPVSFSGPIGSPYPMMQMQRQMPTIDLPSPEDALPPGWKAGVDKAGNTYFYNKELNVSQWTRPGVAGFGGGLAQGGGVAGGLTSKGARSAPCFMHAHFV